MTRATQASCVALLVGVFVFPRAARADEPARAHLPIQFSAPPECPSEADLRSGIQRLLRDPDGDPTGVASVKVDIQHQEAGKYALELDLVDAHGSSHKRQLVGDTCAAVVDAAAVAIALAGDAESPPATSDAPVPVPVPVPTALPPVAQPPPPYSGPTTWPGSWPPPPDVPSRRSAPHLTWDLDAHGGVDFASLPGPAPGFGLGATAEIAKNRVELRASAWLPERARIATRTSTGGDVSLYVGSLRYGRSLFAGMFDLVPCGGIELGALVAKGIGAKTSKTGAGPWVAPSLGAMGVLHASRGFAVSLELEGLVLASRPRFEITAAGQVYQPPPATGRALVAVHARFP